MDAIAHRRRTWTQAEGETMDDPGGRAAIGHRALGLTTTEGKPGWYRHLGITELRTVAAGKSPDWLELEFPDLQAPGGPAASRESKVTPGAQPADVKDGLRMLQDASTPAMEGSRRIANAFAQRLVQRMVGDR